jgi:pimeloyl-ACP methyl ester carboxylesterase
VLATVAGWRGVEADVLPGRAKLDHALGRCSVAVPTPRATAGRMLTGSFPSDQLRGDVGFTVAYPPGEVDRLPVCLLLHGAGWRHDGWFDAMRFHRHLADAVAGGTPPFALAACDGGPLFWHRREGGLDPQAMLVQEFLPLLADRGLLVAGGGSGEDRKVGVLGCSMGGYGALLLGVEHPERCAVVVASSPAVSLRPPGGSAFDSPADFAAHDVIARADALRSLPVRIDCGERDGYRDGVEALAARLPGTVRFAPGCHEPSFWESRAPAQLAFVGRQLRGGGKAAASSPT